jgi:hypothetical protein
VVKPRIIIIVSGILLLIGIGITWFQSDLTSENLSNQQNTIPAGTQMTVSKELDPSNNQNGVYSIQVTDFKNTDDVKITITNPAGSPIIANSLTKSPIQESFTISSIGNYTLHIENHGQREIQVLGIIGYFPQWIELADISGFIALIIGLSGLAVGMMFLVRNRAKPSS